MSFRRLDVGLDYDAWRGRDEVCLSLNHLRVINAFYDEHGELEEILAVPRYSYDDDGTWDERSALVALFGVDRVAVFKSLDALATYRSFVRGGVE